MTYRWNNPQEWLLDRVRGESPGWVFAAIETIIPLLDADFVQDLFQDEMDRDGYFEETHEKV